jgi:hypothetical protein
MTSASRSEFAGSLRRFGCADNPIRTNVSVMSDFREHVVMNCRTPVLIVPYASQCDSIGKSVLIAWNGSEEATQEFITRSRLFSVQ